MPVEDSNVIMRRLKKRKSDAFEGENSDGIVRRRCTYDRADRKVGCTQAFEGLRQGNDRGYFDIRKGDMLCRAAKPPRTGIARQRLPMRQKMTAAVITLGHSQFAERT